MMFSACMPASLAHARQSIVGGSGLEGKAVGEVSRGKDSAEVRSHSVGKVITKDAAAAA